MLLKCSSLSVAAVNSGSINLIKSTVYKTYKTTLQGQSSKAMHAKWLHTSYGTTVHVLAHSMSFCVIFCNLKTTSSFSNLLPVWYCKSETRWKSLLQPKTSIWGRQRPFWGIFVPFCPFWVQYLAASQLKTEWVYWAIYEISLTCRTFCGLTESGDSPLEIYIGKHGILCQLVRY